MGLHLFICSSIQSPIKHWLRGNGVPNCWRYREQGEDGCSLSIKRAGQGRWRGKWCWLAFLEGWCCCLERQEHKGGMVMLWEGRMDHELVTWDLPVQTFIKQLGHETEAWREAWRASQVSAKLWCGVA